MKSSSSMRQIADSCLFLPTSGLFDLGLRVLSLPSLEVVDLCGQPDLVRKHHTSVDDLGADILEQHPASCMVDTSRIHGPKAPSAHTNSSHSSSSASISVSDSFQRSQRLPGNLCGEPSMEVAAVECHSEGDICLQVPLFPALASDSLEDVTVRSTPVDDLSPFSTSSSLSPPKLGVPSKAAAILGAREMFISPSHAAYRRLVDFTHRPAGDGHSLLNTDAPYPPTLTHPSLVARTNRKSKSETKPFETSPEKKTGGKYKIRSIGIEDVKEKLNFLRKPGEFLGSGASSDPCAAKQTKPKESERLQVAGGASMKQIRKWSTSFEELLHDKYGLALFHGYLKSEYSEENIEFWIACEEYKAIGNPKKMAIRAHKIIKDFVATQASKEINLDSKTRQQTLDNIQNPNSKMFEMAQKRIQTLMEIDSYQRFLRSAMYQSLLQDITNASMTEENPRSPPASVRTDRPGVRPGNGSHSSASSTDLPDSDSILSLQDLRSPDPARQAAPRQAGHSIIRISSVKAPRPEGPSEARIPPSSSENCLNNASR